MSMKEKVLKILKTWNTEHHADSIEWCPIEPFHDIFVCGTYQLSEKVQDHSQKRFGKIHLFHYDPDTNVLKLIQEIESPGVLDQKWSNHLINGLPYLGIVNSKGSLQLYSLTDITLILESEVNLDSNVIVTSLDWSNNKYEEENPTIAVSDVKGKINLFKYHSRSKELENINSWLAHDYESWMCVFNSWNQSILCSGGDDCKLKFFDLKIGIKPIATISRDMGVTSARFNDEQEHVLVTGSYDEILCIWDMRKLKNVLSEIPLGGGIWRLKWEPKKYNLLSAACMYGGISILDCKDLYNPTIVMKHNEKEVLTYGIDWCHKKKNESYEESNMIVTCSFYDNKLNIITLS